MTRSASVQVSYDRASFGADCLEVRGLHWFGYVSGGGGGYESNDWSLYQLKF